MLELIGALGAITALSGYGLLSAKKYVWGQIVSIIACFAEGYYTYEHNATFNVLLSIAWALIAIVGLAYWAWRKNHGPIQYSRLWLLNRVLANPSK